MSHLRSMERGRLEPSFALTRGLHLQDRLGSGGFGDLYRARTPGGHLQAVRLTDIPDAPVVLDAIAEVIALHERFEDAPLARIRACGGDEQRLWYAMDLLEGESVLAWVRSKGALAPGNATRLLIQMSADL